MELKASVPTEEAMDPGYSRVGRAKAFPIATTGQVHVDNLFQEGLATSVHLDQGLPTAEETIRCVNTYSICHQVSS